MFSVRDANVSANFESFMLWGEAVIGATGTHQVNVFTEFIPVASLGLALESVVMGSKPNQIWQICYFETLWSAY
jgi:hypothetical protein